MRKLIFALLLVLPFFAIGKTGVYLTAEDYLNGKVDAAGDEIEILHNALKIVVKNGKAVVKEYDLMSIWGFTNYKDGQQHVYRFMAGAPVILELKGDIYYYGTKDNSYFDDAPLGTTSQKMIFPFVSKGAAGAISAVPNVASLAQVLGMSWADMKASPCFSNKVFEVVFCMNKSSEKKE